MIYTTQKGRVSAGEAIGILLLDTSVPFIPGDVANATTYPFPVRFKKIDGFTLSRALSKDPDIYEDLLAAARELQTQGVRAITGDCGFMGIHQKRLSRDVHVPVFLSSLLQIPFISAMVGSDAKIGIITAHSGSLDAELLAAVGVSDPKNLVIRGLEDRPHFYSFAIEESGSLNFDAVKDEVVDTARKMVACDRQIEAILLECSLLPPYAAVVQDAVKLAVFDYITMIKYVFSAVVQQGYGGFM